MKKKLIWCIGPEGMGHHMCQEIFRDIWQKGGKFDNQFPQIIQYWNSSVVNNLDIFFNDILVKVSERPFNTFVFTPSSPYDNPRDSLRRPDILEFYTHFSKVLDIKLIHTYRNPIDATYSLIRRGWFKYNDNRIINQILYQAKIVEDNLLYNKCHLEVIGKDNWKTLEYEKVIENPSSIKNTLSEWVGERLVVENGLSRIIKPHDRDNIPKNELSTLERFFTKKRLNMWEEFYLSNSL